MSSHPRYPARVVPLRPAPASAPTAVPVREPLWRDLVGEVLRRERLAQERTLKDVAEAARISMPYLSEVERGRKEASSEVLAAAARALGLNLAELLALAQRKLPRPVRTGPRRAPGVAGHGGAAVPETPSEAPPGPDGERPAAASRPETAGEEPDTDTAATASAIASAALLERRRPGLRRADVRLAA